MTHYHLLRYDGITRQDRAKVILLVCSQHTDAFDVMSEGFQILMVTLSIFMEHLNMEILLAIPLNSCVENS